MYGLPIRVLVVEDQERWRRFYSSALQKLPELQVIAEARDGLEGVEVAQQLQPDLILLDIGLPRLNGIEACLRIREVSAKSKILFVSENRSFDIVEKALSDGAGGYVLKSDAGRELLPAVEAVLQGKRFVSASLAGHDPVTSDTGVSEGEHRIAENPYLRFAKSTSISELLASVTEATAADFGIVQLFDSANCMLRIVAQHGFDSEFLNYFDTAGDEAHPACSGAMKKQSRIVVTDVSTDPLFSNQLKNLLLRAKVRSFQSTPLIDSSEKVVGVVSTLYSRPEGFKPYMGKVVDDLAASFRAS